MNNYLPAFLMESKVFRNLIDLEDIELKGVRNKVDDILNQCFITTATWGLKYWEEFLGIPVDETKDAEYRRSVIKSKIRGTGTVTVNLIKTVSQSYSNGEVEIIEENPKYQFTVKFVGTKGIPPNIEDLKQAIEQIKPAHLQVEYKFTYTTWGEVKNLTWNQIKSGGWKALRTRKVI